MKDTTEATFREARCIYFEPTLGTCGKRRQDFPHHELHNARYHAFVEPHGSVVSTPVDAPITPERRLRNLASFADPNTESIEVQARWLIEAADALDAKDLKFAQLAEELRHAVEDGVEQQREIERLTAENADLREAIGEGIE